MDSVRPANETQPGFTTRLREGGIGATSARLASGLPVETVDELEWLLSEPTPELVEMMRRLPGDILLLGAGGKIGPSLARMARRASELAGDGRRVIGVSRFSNPDEAARLNAFGVETVACDLMDEAAVDRLPDAPNIIYLPALKFGSTGQAAMTWAVNTYLPSVVCRRYRHSRIVAYSTGGVYGLSPVAGGGALESETPMPVGEYAASCLGRERMFEYFSGRFGIPVALIRLFYACELRYGVLVDLAQKVLTGEAIDLSMGYFNIIWQGDNNAMTLRALEHAASPPLVLNVTGMEVLSVLETAATLGELLGRAPVFQGRESETSCLGRAGEALRLFGPSRVSARQLLGWVAHWVSKGGPSLDKPTHFEVRDGRY